jgi:hypothetical protein
LRGCLKSGVHLTREHGGRFCVIPCDDINETRTLADFERFVIG